MTDYREILRLKGLGYSQRQIERGAHSSHHTIQAVLAAAEQQNIAWPLDDDVTNRNLHELLFPEKSSAGSVFTQPDFPYIHRELAKPKVNLTLLWKEYCVRVKDEGGVPYQYTQFCEKYRKWARVTKATMRITHKPGDVMQVDWAGNTLYYQDPVTGDEQKAYLFIAVLPCSCFAYVEACDNMQTETWLLCHIHAYNYFGGVTRLLVPDNLKTGIVANTRYDTVFNKSYQEMTEYYGTAIVPARVRHDRVASHVRLQKPQRDPVVKPEHMSPEHRKYLTYNASDFTQWAAAIGENTSRVVKHFLASGKEPEQGKRSIMARIPTQL